MTDPSHPSPAPPAAAEELVIEAGRADLHYWRDLWRYRELLGFLAWRDIKVRYKQTVLGVAWAVIQPAVQTILLTFVFSKLARMPDGGVPYPLLVLAGLLPWQLFSSAFSGAGGSLVGNAHLISKVYFPRLVVPLSALVVALVDLAVLLVVSGGFALTYGVLPTWHVLLLPVFMLAGLLIALGAGLWVSALTVKYRDFRIVMPFLLQIGVFVTPVGYRTDFLPNWRDLLALNPLTGVVDGFRWCLLGTDYTIYEPGLIVSLAVTLILLGTGLWFFRRTERQFADVI
ncbi:MAG TPA: ABC transporter permease [Opitutaceae bacterium]|nr:ABC transporter permease [Opitutaceae bacterium]